MRLNEARLNVLSTVLRSIVEQSTSDGIILFPASMFYTEEKQASTYYNRVQETLIPVLAPDEDQIELAPAFLSEDDGKSRIFVLNGISYYMCVCHDIFGLRHKPVQSQSRCCPELGALFLSAG